MTARALSGGAAAVAIMRLTWTRLFRGRSFLVSLILAGLPLLFLLALASRWSEDARWARTMGVAIIPLLAVLPPLNLAPIVAEEAEDFTYSYLWSRPFPRWAVLAGKVAALLPFVLGLLFAVATATWLLSYRGDPEQIRWLYRGVLGLGLGAVAAGALAVAFGLLIRKQAVAVSAGYLLVIDLPIGQIPLSISNLSITHHARIIADYSGNPGSLGGSIVWLLAITAVLVAVAVWRVERAELSSA